MLIRGGKKIPLAVYILKTYLAVFFLTFQPKKMAGFHDYCFIFAHLSGIYQNLSACHSVMGKLGNEAP